MRINKFGDCIVNPDDIFQGLYTGKIKDLTSLNIEDESFIEQYNRSIKANGDDIFPLTPYQKPKLLVDEVDKKRQEQWMMPKSYNGLNIEDYLLNLCQTDLEKNKVNEELALFKKYNMIPLLRYLKYLVDVMKENNIVWGLGRGSSVASYCLYLLEVHQIDSIKYNLDIKEFLR
jgi:DNA polymerase III alpha subunit